MCKAGEYEQAAMCIVRDVYFFTVLAVCVFALLQVHGVCVGLTILC
jgi:hypothetical protein